MKERHIFTHAHCVVLHHNKARVSYEWKLQKTYRRNSEGAKILCVTKLQLKKNICAGQFSSKVCSLLPILSVLLISSNYCLAWSI
jgi:hypothetical protein